MNEPHWIIHLPTTLTSLDTTVELVQTLRSSLTHVPALDFGETTLSEEDKQSLRTRLWCDARIDGPGGGPGGRRCQRPDDHPGACGPDPP